MSNYYDIPPFAQGSDTSRAAAESMRSEAAVLRDRIFRTIEKAGERGMTCDEVELRLTLTHQTASARVNELMNTGHIVDSQHRRDTRSGRKAIVWIKSNDDPGSLKKIQRRRMDRWLDEIARWPAAERAEMIQEILDEWCSECGATLGEYEGDPCPKCGAT